MLLLMRRAGEIIRINEKIILQVKEIHAESVTFTLEGLNENEADQKKNKASKVKAKTKVEEDA